MKKIKYGIIGATGHTAQELLSLTSQDENLECVFLTSSSEAGNFSAFLPEKKYEALSDEEIIARNPDVIFYATPHGVCMKNARKFLEKNIKIIDLSGDFRFANHEIFEKNYDIKHSAPEIKAQYGLTEHFRDEIKNSQLIANPGCYVTASLNALLPIKENIVSAVCDGKSGYSGAGKSFTAEKIAHLEKNICIPYKIIQHRHEAEIQQFFSGETRISFTPHLINTFRGMIVTVHIFLKEEFLEKISDKKNVGNRHACSLRENVRNANFHSKNVGEADLRPLREKIFQKFVNFYKDEPLIKIQKEIPEISAVQGKNCNILGGFELDQNGRLVIVSALDNLRKGAVSQALQNMYVMMGVEENLPEVKNFLEKI
jgi:N-acetyl-gamma-glutamyl-phosphate reductase